MQEPTDCLVLKIEEYGSSDNKLDTSLYVIYDKAEHMYIIRGKRFNEGKHNFQPFSFMCKNSKELTNFISFVICKTSLWSYVLCNYDNLHYNSDDITYEYLEENESYNYELAGYDKVKFNKTQLRNNLRMLNSVFNYY